MNLNENPNINLKPAEITFYSKLFKIADTASDGIISPNQAVAILSTSKLPQEMLGKIWSLADSQQRGFLTQQGFYKALKWIAIAQSGIEPSANNLSTPTSIPKLDGFMDDSSINEIPKEIIPPQVTGNSTNSDVINIEDIIISNEERERYTAAYISCNPIDGLISGETARDCFLPSGLPLETLGKLWSLIDTSGKGSIDKDQFLCAMVLIQKIMQGVLVNVPSSLPKSLWNSIIGGDSAKPNSQAETHESPIISDNKWAIPEIDINQFGLFFEKLDKQKLGLITGEQCYSFFVKSKLPQSELAVVWDLSDINKQGKLTKEEFILAMYLIKEKMAGKEFPKILPPSYIPPSCRSNLLKRESINSARKKTSFSSTPTFKPSVTPQIGNLMSDMTIPTEIIGDTSTILKSEKIELNNIKNQVQSIKSSSAELKSKADVYQSELSTVLAEKKILMEQFKASKLQYDADLEEVFTCQGMITKEKEYLATLISEKTLQENAFSSLKNEKLILDQELFRVRAESSEAKRMIQEYSDLTKSLRLELEKINQDLKRESQFLELNQKLQKDAAEEVKSISDDLKKSTAEFDRVKVAENIPPKISTYVNSNMEIPEDPFASFRVPEKTISPRGPPPPIPLSKKPTKLDQEFTLESEAKHIPAISAISSISVSSISKFSTPFSEKAAKDEIDALINANLPKANRVSANKSKGSLAELSISDHATGFQPQFSGSKGPASVHSLTTSLMDTRADSDEFLVNRPTRPSSIRSVPAKDDTHGIPYLRMTSTVAEENLDFPDFGSTQNTFNVNAQNTLSKSIPNEPNSVHQSPDISKNERNKVESDLDFNQAFNMDSFTPISTQIPISNIKDVESAFDFSSFAFEKSVPVKNIPNNSTAVPINMANPVPNFSSAFETMNFPTFSKAEPAVHNFLSDEDLNDAFSVKPGSSQIDFNVKDTFGTSKFISNNSPDMSNELRSLLDLGFNKDDAMRALESNNYNLEKATNALLDK